MIQRKITHYINEEKRALDKQLIRELKKIADKHSLQYALLWYIYLRSNCTLRELYRVYRHLSEKTIRENTVRKQLQQLEVKGLVKKQGDRYYCLVDPREVIDLFDKARSKAGRIGATIRHMKIRSRSLKISPGLKYYTEKIIEEAKKLVRKGKRAVALDLLVHTLLPLRKNGILWLWHGDFFVYYEPKAKTKMESNKEWRNSRAIKEARFY